MESIVLLRECETQGNDVSALAKVAEEGVREAGGAELGRGTKWTVGHPARQRRGRAFHMLLPDDGLGDRGTVKLVVRHGPGARYQYNVRVPNAVVTTAVA